MLLSNEIASPNLNTCDDLEHSVSLSVIYFLMKIDVKRDKVFL